MMAKQGFLALFPGFFFSFFSFRYSRHGRKLTQPKRDKTGCKCKIPTWPDGSERR